MRKPNKIKERSLEDKAGEFIGYCTFHAHPGVIRPSYTKVCEARNCVHYRKLYIELGVSLLDIKRKEYKT